MSIRLMAEYEPAGNNASAVWTGGGEMLEKGEGSQRPIAALQRARQPSWP